MLTAKQMQELKRVNVSKDAEKTKKRVSEDFKSTSRVNKKAILDLSGLKRHTFYRVFDTGAATAKVVLSMAQILNVSPYYYLGAEDDKGECTDEIIVRFLQEHGYERIIKEMERTSDRNSPYYVNYDANMPPQTMNENQNALSIKAQIVESYHSSNDKLTLSITLDDSKKMRDVVESIDEESSILLLKALFIRAEANGDAEALSNLVKRCLLS